MALLKTNLLFLNSQGVRTQQFEYSMTFIGLILDPHTHFCPIANFEFVKDKNCSNSVDLLSMD